jgi:transposase
VTARSAAD